MKVVISALAHTCEKSKENDERKCDGRQPRERDPEENLVHSAVPAKLHNEAMSDGNRALPARMENHRAPAWR
jgi:hypothetical protein